MGRGLLYPGGPPENTWPLSVFPRKESFPSEPVIRLGFTPFLLKPSISTAMEWEYIPQPRQELALPACAAGEKADCAFPTAWGAGFFTTILKICSLLLSALVFQAPPELQPLCVPLAMNFLLPQPGFSLFSHTHMGSSHIPGCAPCYCTFPSTITRFSSRETM